MRKILILVAALAVVFLSGVLRKGGGGHSAFKPWTSEAVELSGAAGKPYVVLATADW